jgi:rhodanese-related sulfurtransferase
MHRHIPYVVPDFDHTYDPAAQRYRLETNPDFVKAVDNLLIELKLDRRATLIIYCSVGERSARAANLLNRSGFASAYSMVDGFDGHPKGKAGLGWKANGLPWTYALKASQAYKSPTM